MDDLKNSSFLLFFYFDLYILNFDILFSYSNKQDKPSFPFSPLM